LETVATGGVAAGTAVCVDDVRVTSNETYRPYLGDDGRYGVFEVTDGEHVVTARIDGHGEKRWWDHGTPAEGMLVDVQGTVTEEGVISPVERWFDENHEGETVRAADVARGNVTEHSYVWVEATVGFTFTAPDGDTHVEVGTFCPMAHLVTEVTPPYRAWVPAPDEGQTVRVFGQVRYDPGHGWWEVHPIRAWEPITKGDRAEHCPDTDQPLPPPGVVPDKLPP
jgi:hypothetical protein